MNKQSTIPREALERMIESAGFECAPSFKSSPSGLLSAWVNLKDSSEIIRFATELKSLSCRLATVTVYRPDGKSDPDLHEIAYHFLFEGMPVTVKVSLRKDEELPSITPVFINADWEEREMMELANIKISGHPNYRRLFLDESIEAGVFDRYVPYSEITNAGNHDAVWKRIKEESCVEQREKAIKEELNNQT